MKVHIGKYTSWFGPYQLAEKLCFWAKPVVDEHGFKSEPDWVHNFGEWLAHGSVLPEATPENPTSKWNDDDRPITPLYKLLRWIDSKKKQKLQVHIHRWDTWSMDHTLSHIILPMLEQLQKTKQGAPYVDDDDVPEELRSTSAPPKENEWDTDANHFKRWDWVIDEMIFAFRNKVDDNWEAQFASGTHDWRTEATDFDDQGKPKLYTMVTGPNHSYKIDKEKRDAYQKRISNGFRLFGKYYEGLWS